MKKISLSFFLFIFWNSVFASSQLNSSILKSMQNNQRTSENSSMPIVYGGQDISKPLFASADESFWSISQAHRVV